MDEKVYTLEEIEAFCLGRLPTEKQKAIEERIAEDESFQHRVGLIRSILEGFLAMATEDLEEKMNSWSGGLAAQEDEELIEWYLTDELGPKAKQYVEERRKTDTAFDTLFQSQKRLLEGLDAIQTDAFANQLTAWEREAQEETPVRSLNPWIKRLSIAASIALLVSIGGWGYMKNQYSNQKLFASLYQSPNIGGTLGGATIDQFKEEFSAAHRSLQGGEYAVAIRQFTTLSNELEGLELDPLAKTYYEQNVDWSLLLAKLAGNQINDGFRSELARIAGDESHEYRLQASSLQKKLDSFWR